MTGAAFCLLAVFFEPGPTAAQAQEVAALLARLESPRYAVRERASADLEKVGGPAKRPLREAMRHKDAEVAGRAQAIFDRIVQAQVESLLPLPYLDAFWFDVESKTYVYTVQCAEMSNYLDLTGRDGRPWHNYRRATELWVRVRLADGASPRGLRLVLAALHAKDEVFIGTCPPDEDEADPPVVVNWRDYLAAGK